MELFDQLDNSARPLADRMRPKSLDEFVGQSHLLAPGKVLRQSIEQKKLVSMILWGPPGVGKTTLARIMARETGAEFVNISAVTSGVADIRKTITRARSNKGQPFILFIDEIHRFNKAQQDALLHSVEDGTLLLIGATTENPSFEVISALLSRCRVYKLEHLNKSDLKEILHGAMEKDSVLKDLDIEFTQDAESILIDLCGGDARNLLTALELAVRMAESKDQPKRQITRSLVEEALQRRTLIYDKKGEYHYDVISAFIKSVRGSDPDAAIYWLARMLESGEDPLFVARRLIILASEDVGNADPHALMVATSAFHAVHAIGMPEARITLAQVTTYLASAPKSNAAYLAIEEARQELVNSKSGDVPLHLRNAPTSLMKSMGYAAGYIYPHDKGGFADQDYFPSDVSRRIYYRPTENGIEKKIKDRLSSLWPKRKR